MEYIFLSGLAIVGGQLINKNKGILGYTLIAASWIGIAIKSVIELKSWKLGILSLVLGGAFIAFLAYDQKKRTIK